jgi:hypothetical protein
MPFVGPDQPISQGFVGPDKPLGFVGPDQPIASPSGVSPRNSTDRASRIAAITADVNAKSAPPTQLSWLDKVLASGPVQTSVGTLAHPITAGYDIGAAINNLLGGNLPQVDVTQGLPPLLNLRVNPESVAPGWQPAAEEVASQVSGFTAPDALGTVPLMGAEALGQKALLGKVLTGLMGGQAAGQSVPLAQAVVQGDNDTAKRQAVDIGLGGTLAAIGIHDFYPNVDFAPDPSARLRGQIIASRISAAATKLKQATDSGASPDVISNLRSQIDEEMSLAQAAGSSYSGDINQRQSRKTILPGFLVGRPTYKEQLTDEDWQKLHAENAAKELLSQAEPIPRSRQLKSSTQYQVTPEGNTVDINQLSPSEQREFQRSAQAQSRQADQSSATRPVNTIAAALERPEISKAKVEETTGQTFPKSKVSTTAPELVFREAWEKKENQRWASPANEYGPGGELSLTQVQKLWNFRQWLKDPNVPIGQIERLAASVSDVKPEAKYDMLFKNMLDTRLKQMGRKPAEVLKAPPNFPLEQPTVIPAIQVEGQTFTGQDHVEAYANAKQQGQADTSGAQEGFVDKQGRFLTREQAAQVTGLPTTVEPGKLHSEDLPKLGGGESQLSEADRTKSRENNSREAFLRANKGKLPAPQKPKEVIPSETQEKEKEQDVLRVEPGMHTADLLTQIAENPETHGRKEALLAGWLVDKFPTLMSSPVDLGEHPSGGAAYEPNTHTVHMAMGDGNSPVWKALHEGAHAATVWAYNHPLSAEQSAAKVELDRLFDMAKKALPDTVRAHLEETFGPEMAKRQAGRPHLSPEQMDAVTSRYGWRSSDWGQVMYALTSPDEFIAQVFSSEEFREFLDNIKDPKGPSLLQRTWNSFKALLGISGNQSALSTAFDAIAGLSENTSDFTGPERPRLAPPKFKEEASKDVLEKVSGRIPLGKQVEKKLNKWAGFSAPRTMAAGRELGNKLVRYASARIAAPKIAKSKATDVLGSHWKDEGFNERLGATIVEDLLRQIKKTSEAPDKVETIVGKEHSPFQSETQFQAALKDPEIQAAIARHKEIVQGKAEQMHVALGGKLAASGEETGAFVNLKNILTDPDSQEPVNMADVVNSGRKGNLTNPIQRGSVFSRERKGTGKNYVLDYRTLAERMIRNNYEEYAKKQLYDEYVKSGMGVVERPGKPPLIGGKPTASVPIKLGKTWQELKVRADLAPELRQALQTDSPIEHAGLQHLLDLATDVQVVGPTDVVYHMANMLSSIAGSQGRGGFIRDIIGRQLGIRELDAIGRITYNAMRVIHDGPEVQKALAQLAAIGAGRSKSVASHGLLKNINAVTAKLINFTDKAGRLALNQMYNDLVKRGITKASEEGRREFVNKMGQYNERLMTKRQQAAREYSIAPFNVAGRTFNRLAMQRLMLNPGVKAANPSAWFKLRLNDALAFRVVPFVLGVVANQAITGTNFGRKGVPAGAIDTGKNDKDGRPIYWDMEQTSLLRRGERITGISALEHGLETGQSAKQIANRAGNDIVAGVLHPWVGPAVSAIGQVGFPALAGKSPNQFGANVQQALQGMNPTMAKVIEGGGKAGDTSFGQQMKAGGKEALASLAGAVGLKRGAFPTKEDKETAKAQELYGKPLEQLSKAERAKVQKALPKQEVSDADKAAGAKAAIDKELERKQALEQALPSDIKDWLKANRLELPGYGDSESVNKVRVPFTEAEEARYGKAVAEGYEREIRKLMADQGFQSKLPSAKNLILTARLNMVKNQARRLVLGAQQ